MKDFLLLPIGVGDAFTKDLEKGNTGFVIISGEQRLLVDCPAYLGALMKKASRKSGFDMSLEDITDVIITHLHEDHINGLAELGHHMYFAKKFEKEYREKGGIPERIKSLKKPVLHSSLCNLAGIWRKKLQGSMGQLLVDAEKNSYKRMMFQDYFVINHLSFNKPNRIGNLEIEIRETKHHIPNFALKIKYKEKVLGISSDTAYDERLIDWLSSADMILHEINFGAAHTPYEKLFAYVSSKPELKDIIYLYHLSDLIDTEQIQLKILEQGGLYEI